jgi:hypothetical protein
LRDFGLVGGVGGEELAALDEGVDDDGLVVLIDAGAEEAGVAVGVVVGVGTEAVDDLGFAVLAGTSRSRVSWYSAGMVAKRASMLGTPISASISSRSAGLLGR